MCAECSSPQLTNAALQIPNPEFEGQTKTRLGNPEVRKLVDNMVSAVRFWLGRASRSRPASCSRQASLACWKACIAVRLASFEVQTKTRLGNPEVCKLVDNMVSAVGT